MKVVNLLADDLPNLFVASDEDSDHFGLTGRKD